MTTTVGDAEKSEQENEALSPPKGQSMNGKKKMQEDERKDESRY